MHLYFHALLSLLQARTTGPPSSETGLVWQLADEFWNLWAALGAGTPPQWLSWKALQPVWCRLPISAWVTGFLGTSPLRTWWLLGVSVEGCPVSTILRQENISVLFMRDSVLFFFSLSSLFSLLTSLCSPAPSQPRWLKADTLPRPWT